MTINIEQLPGLVEAVRSVAADCRLSSDWEAEARTIDEAADTLESLAAENERFREALEQIDGWCCPLLCTNCKDNREFARKALSGGAPDAP